MNKLAYVEDIARHVSDLNHKVKIFDVWTELKRASNDIRKPIDKSKVLNAANLDELRAIALERIRFAIETDPDSKETDYFIVTHACFRWNKYLRKGMDSHYVRILNPEIYVCIIDDIINIQQNLDNDEQWKTRRFDIEELATWQDEEIFLTRFMADYDNKPVYLIAKREPPKSISRLFLKTEKPRKAYLSYPITAIKKEKPQILATVEALADELRNKIVVFNPLSIKDLEYDYEGIDAEAKKCLREATVQRDFLLIDQSDMIIVFFPVQTNSPGVNSEIAYGYSHNKEVYLYYPYRTSPFWDERIAITKQFTKFEDFCKFFEIKLELEGVKEDE